MTQTTQIELATEIYSPVLLWSNYAFDGSERPLPQNRHNIRTLLSKMNAAITPLQDRAVQPQTCQPSAVCKTRNAALQNQLSESRQRIPVKRVQSGDVVLLKSTNSLEPAVGIVLANTNGDLIVHDKRGTVWQSSMLSDLVFEKQVLSAYKLLG